MRHRYTKGHDTQTVSYTHLDVYKRQTLQDHGIPMDGHRATQLQRQDYDRYDYLVGMDGQNIANMKRILGNDPAGKIYKLLDFTGTGGDIAAVSYTHLMPPTRRVRYCCSPHTRG